LLEDALALMPIKGSASRAPTVAVVHSPHSSSSLLFGSARRIRAEFRAHPSYQPLRGKNLAVLLACPPGPESALLQAAAVQLGARVALVRYSHRTDRDIDTLAGALGRMYDAIDCECLPAPVPQQMARHAGVPVIDGLGNVQHRMCALADLLTLLEHPRAAQTPLSIRLAGDADNPRARQFLAAARDMGFDVLTADGGREGCNDATFEVDTMQSGRWSLRAHGSALDEATRSDNHLRLVQAVLLDEMAGVGR
jgi:ornithine carbamoyltransferase